MVFLPTFTIIITQMEVNMGKYTIHGPYGRRIVCSSKIGMPNFLLCESGKQT